jgi:TetR/AcrR family transcriptional regulator, cholesterol catabolism regulator
VMIKKSKTSENTPGAPDHIGVDSTRKMSKNSVKAGLYREQLFEAVAQVLLKHRKATFTLDEVAMEIGVSKGVIYYYFQSKGEMIYRLNKYMFDLIRKALTPIYNDPALTPRCKLEKLISAYIGVVVTRWKISRLLWSDMALRETSAHQAGVINRERKALRVMLTRVLKDIVITERLEPIDEHLAAWLIYGILSFVPMWFRPGRGASEEEISEYVAKLVSGGFLNRRSPG